MSDTDNVAEISYVDLGEGVLPHWTSLEPDQERIVVTAYGSRMNEVMVVRVDQDTGALTVDTDFDDDGKVSFESHIWPHGETGGAVLHGAVFSNR